MQHNLTATLAEWQQRVMQFTAQQTLSEALQHHICNNIPLTESVFRAGSDSYFQLFNYARQQLKESDLLLSALDKALLSETDIGMFADYMGEAVPLDYPMPCDEQLSEADYKGKEVELNKPKRGGSKKYYVYVKNPDTGNVNKIEFGDTSGLKEKISDPEARKNFAARHQCDKKKDKTTAGYWSCNLPRYAKSLGLSGGGNYYW